MNDLHEPSTDPAADAIRAALPTPDADATERIARRIADGEAARATVRRMPRVRNGRTVLKPALALAVIALAGGVALLAPARDDHGHGVGPRLAAAAALRDAGTTASDADWHPLRAGEYEYTSTSWTDPMHRVRLTEDRWTAADGTGRLQMRQASMQPAGTTYWTPAIDCDTVYAVPSPLSPQRYVPAGSALPACWKQQGALAGAFGEIVDTPPDGALVDGVDTYGASGEIDSLHVGSTVTEQSGPPPGAVETKDADGTVLSAVAGPITEEAPARTPKATTWVRVVAGEHLMRQEELTPHMPSPIFGALDVGLLIPRDQIATLPSDADELLTLLHARVDPALAIQRAHAKAGDPALTPSTETSAIVNVATQLLTTASLSPAQRKALFDALAKVADESGATVQRSVSLPDGGDGRAMRIRFIDHPPAGPAGTKPIDFEMDLYLDEETNELRAQSFGNAGDPNPYVTTWERSRRVTSLERPTD
jgi:hypothetical protein